MYFQPLASKLRVRKRLGFFEKTVLLLFNQITNKFVHIISKEYHRFNDNNINISQFSSQLLYMSASKVS